jgi:hypothetical protein
LFLVVDTVSLGSTCRHFYDGEKNFLIHSNVIVGKILSQKKVDVRGRRGTQSDRKFDPLSTKIAFEVEVQETISYEPTLPSSLRYLMRGLGTVEESGELLSYLLFESSYCSALCDLGRADTMARAGEIREFFRG